jgi:hypothetical protein
MVLTKAAQMTTQSCELPYVVLAAAESMRVNPTTELSETNRQKRYIALALSLGHMLRLADDTKVCQLSVCSDGTCSCYFYQATTKQFY